MYGILETTMHRKMPIKIKKKDYAHAELENNHVMKMLKTICISVFQNNIIRFKAYVIKYYLLHLTTSSHFLSSYRKSTLF